MPTVINDLTLEPKASPPAEEAKGSSGGSPGLAGPELERQVQQIERRHHDRTLRLWDVGEGQELRSMATGGGGLWGMAYSRDGARALSGGVDQIVRLWDVATRREIRQLPGFTEGLEGPALSPDGKILACPLPKTRR